MPKAVILLQAIPKNDRGKVAKGELIELWVQRAPSVDAAGAGLTQSSRPSPQS